MEFSCGFSAAIATSVSTTTAFATLGFGDVDLDLASFDLAVVEGRNHCFALVFFSDEDETEALRLATGSGGEDDFVHRGVGSDHGLELVLGSREGKVSNVELESFRLFAFLPPFLLVVIGVSNTDASAVDSMAVESLDGSVSH